jgi:hypothetical protein
MTLAHETDRSFHAPCFVTARDRRRSWLEPIPGGKFQQPWMEADRIGIALSRPAGNPNELTVGTTDPNLGILRLPFDLSGRAPEAVM